MAITVTGSTTNNTFGGGLLKVQVLTNAALAGTPATGSSTTAYNCSVTTTATGSFVFGTLDNQTASTTFVASAGCTITDQASINAGGAQGGAFKTTSATGTPGATTVGSSTTFAGNTGVVAMEVLASGGTLTVDGSSPAVVTDQVSTSWTTASFTPPAGSVLAAMLTASGNGSALTCAGTVSDTSGLTWTEQVKINSTVGADNSYLAVWTAVVPAGGVTFTPQRYGQAAAPSPAPWEQRPYRSVPGAVDTPANPLVPPLDSAWQASGGYWHLYGDTAARDRRAYFTQRNYISDPNLLAAVNADPLALNPEQSSSSDLWRVAAVPAFYDRRLVPQQRTYYGPPVTALLENELLGGAEAPKYYRTPATHADRREVPAQRVYYDPALLATAELENELLGGGGTSRYYLTAAYWDRREVPQQRPCISDPSFYPSGAVTDPLTVAWGAGGPYWHLYNRAADITDRREYFTQRLYQSDPLLLLTALLENELLGGAETGKYYRQPATHAARWWMPQQPARLADPLLIQTAELENELLGGAGTAQRYGSAAYYDRREVPQQRLYISDPSFYPSGAVTDPLTVAWGAGGNYWHLYNRAADATDRREVPQQRPYVSDPLLLTTALLENELLGGADDTGRRYRQAATHYDRREVPQQRTYPAGIDIPFNPVLAAWADQVRRCLLAATHADRREYPQQRLYFPLPAPPPPFTVGALTAATAAAAALTAATAPGAAAGGIVTAYDQRTGGPG